MTRRRKGLDALSPGERGEATTVARKLDHHPHADIATYLTERMRVQFSAADVAKLLEGGK